MLSSKNRKRPRAAAAAHAENNGLVGYLAELKAESDPDSHWHHALGKAAAAVRKHKSALGTKAEAMRLPV